MPYAFLHFGVAIMQRDPLHTVNKSILRHFRSFFGDDPDVCTCAHVKKFRFMQHKKRSMPQHLLWALMPINMCATEEVLSSFAGTIEKTLR